MKVITARLDGRIVMAVRQLNRLSLYALLAGTLLSVFLTGCQENAPATLRLGSQNIATQQYVVDADKGGVITGAQGTILAIPAGALLDSMGNAVHGPVEIVLKEARRDIDILAGGLITKAGGEILATDGMYMIDARANGKSLRLNPSVGIYASFPTNTKNPDMRLYQGAFDADKLDWRLLEAKEKPIPFCDRDKASREKCKRCERLAKMSKKIKPGKKPAANDYWTKRYVWENGKMVFYSSGSKSTVFSQEQLDDCADYLAGTERGQELNALVEQYKAEWNDRIGEYYSYQLQDFGWYNIDRAVKEELVTFKGRIIDRDGTPMDGANVHLFCKDPELRIHISTVAEDGSFELRFERGRPFLLYAFKKGQIGKQNATLRVEGETLDDLVIAQADGDIDLNASLLAELD